MFKISYTSTDIFSTDGNTELLKVFKTLDADIIAGMHTDSATRYELMLKNIA